ncbi:MAG: glutamine amidotransferase [Dehalococcoidales bacterium]|nr:glutamine amidotransferase [Dehalococcoidales bacterium]
MKKSVYLYVFDTMADWETGYITAEINSGRFFKKESTSLKLVTVGNNKSEVTTMGGLKFKPDVEIAELKIKDVAVLVLPGGDTWLDSVHDAILSVVEECLKENIVVAAICGATFGLARKGFLNGRPHTSNDLEFLKAVCPDYSGEAFYQKQPVVTDGNLITASGIAPLEFSAQVFSKLEVFTPEIVDAWYQLYNTRDPKYYFRLMSEIQ